MEAMGRSNDKGWNQERENEDIAECKGRGLEAVRGAGEQIQCVQREEATDNLNDPAGDDITKIISEWTKTGVEAMPISPERLRDELVETKNTVSTGPNGEVLLNNHMITLYTGLQGGNILYDSDNIIVDIVEHEEGDDKYLTMTLVESDQTTTYSLQLFEEEYRAQETMGGSILKSNL